MFYSVASDAWAECWDFVACGSSFFGSLYAVGKLSSCRPPLQSECIRTHLTGKTRLLWAELRVLVKTLLKHSFGHHFKSNMNQSRSVWTKAQICLKDSQASVNTVQVLRIPLESKLARNWSPLQKLHSSTETPLLNISFKLYAVTTLEFLCAPAMQEKSLWPLCLDLYVHLTGGVCRGAICFLSPLTGGRKCS